MAPEETDGSSFVDGQVRDQAAFDWSSRTEREARLERVAGADRRGELRRAWLDRDFKVVVGVLRDLAPQYEYRAAQLARGLQMTPRHLQRIFATALCCGPREWLNQRRMLAATHLLATGCSIKDTSYRLGFRNPSQFSRDFRGQFGISPSMFLQERLRAMRASRSDRAECPAPPR